MDSRGDIFENPTEEEIKKKKLVPVEAEAKGLSRRDRRALYRQIAKQQRIEKEKKMSRFDYVKYDEESIRHQEHAKLMCDNVRACIETNLKPGRASALAMTKLEEVYMWIGKQIRDDQIARNGSAPLQEERVNS